MVKPEFFQRSFYWYMSSCPLITKSCIQSTENLKTAIKDSDVTIFNPIIGGNVFSELR
jgi:hypothetical protein